MEKDLARPLDRPRQRLARPLSWVGNIEERASIGQSIPPERGEWEVLAQSVYRSIAQGRGEMPLDQLHVGVEGFDALDGCRAAPGEVRTVRHAE